MMDKHIVSLHFHALNEQHIFKDLILIPSMLNKIYGLKATIVAPEIREDVLHSKFKYMGVYLLNKRGNFMQDAADYIIKYGESIDILFFFGPYKIYDIIGEIYKKVNPKGKIYLKLDMNREWLTLLQDEKTFIPILKRADLITVEDKILQKYINDKYNCDVEFLRNGYYGDLKKESTNYEDKENTILTVGRIGMIEKATEVLIEAFLKADLQGWKLKLIGNIEDGFFEKIEKFKNNPKFIEQVEFTGVIQDKKILNNEYKKAKIFAMSSKHEACAHVFSEAAFNGCYIVSTDVDGISDIHEYSSIVPVGDVDSLALALENAAKDEAMAKRNSSLLQEYTKKECTWERIIGRLYLLFCVKGFI